MTDGGRMPAKDALAALHAARGPRDVVITTMATSRDWMAMPQQPLDIVFVPSAMGHATSFGLGLAMAQPQRRVIVCNGDGSMLMNLGSLVTITAADAKNLVVIVLDNGVYEVTGAEPTPGSEAGRRTGGAVDFAVIARGSGFSSVHHYSRANEWASDANHLLHETGPVFVWLDVAAVPGRPGPKSPGPAAPQCSRCNG